MDAAALVCTAASVFIVGIIFWFFLLMGSAEVKGKRGIDLTMGSISRDKVRDKYDRYWSFFCQPTKDIVSSHSVPAFVDSFYDLVTDFYEWGWGQSFHFSPSIPNMSHRDATRVHEERVACLISARPGMRILDAGCGVGGPMRTIARKSGANVVGITINEYQVGRAKGHNKKAGLDSLCQVVCGDFLDMPFEDGSFDAAYSIEATCHAPRLEDVYSEIFRVLKPGATYVTDEWVTTELYDEKNSEHVEIIQGIVRGNALPGLRAYDEVGESARNAGFEVVEERDLAKGPAGPWWTRLKMGRIAYWRNHLLVRAMSFLRITPTGVVEVHETLYETAKNLSRGGEAGIFTPMYMIVCRKPILHDQR